jgi:hypothetical protein
MAACLEAAQADPGGHVEGHDKRMEAAPLLAAPGAKSAAAQARLRERVSNVMVHRDPLTGSPKNISSPRSFLTGPAGEGKSVPAETLRGFPKDQASSPVKAFVSEYRDIFGFGAEAIDAAQLKRDDTTPRSGIRSLVWQQHLDGLPVFGAIFKASLTSNGELINVGSTFVADPPAAAAHGSPRGLRAQAQPAISPERAIIAAAHDVGVEISPADLKAAGAAKGQERRQLFRATGLNNAEAELVWLPMNADSLRLCWKVIFVSRASGRMFQTLVDEETSEVIVRQSLTSDIQNAQYNVYTGESPTPSNPDLASPSSDQPPAASRQVVTFGALNETASPNGWINDGDNSTIGNNVHAHLDTDNNNIADANSSPTGSPYRVFNFALDLASAPSTYQSASTVQLFYWCNFAHDKLYELGFTESAGNFQNDNFGRGGVGGDAVEADNQDASASNINDPTDGVQTNNANFSTPPEPAATNQDPTWKPRMQMYVFDGATPDRDGSLDAEVVIHEYVHGLSNRLVGGGVGMSALQSRGMGEGWSDFYALALLSKQEDDVDGNYAIAAYATMNYLGTSNYANYYFGIRRYPHSSNLNVNPLTFNDIDPAQINLPSNSSVPRNPVNGSGAADGPHAIGGVWCAMLWDARANLVKKWGFATGNQLMLQIVTDGMKLSPVDPTFIEARDAIFQVELALTGGSNFPELEAAFAKRGLGTNATSPASTTTAGVVENFHETTLPVLAVEAPAHNSSVSALTTISGTASDLGGIKDGNVYFTLYHGNTGAFWTGTAWKANTDAQDPAVLLHAAVDASGNWTYSSLPTGGNVRGGQHFLSTYVKDTSDNLSQLLPGVNQTSFSIDAAPPEVAITGPLNGSTVTSQIYSFTGTASDNASINRVVLFIRRLSDNLFWDGGAWISDPLSANLSSSYSSANDTWTCNDTLPIPGGSLGNGSYDFIAIAFDDAGNTHQADSVVTVDFHQIYQWTAGSWSDLDPNNGDWYWGNPANWSPNGIPGNEDIVFIDLDHTVRSTISRTVHGFHMSTGALDFDNGSDSLTITKTGTWTGGTFFDTVFIQPTASFAMSGGGVKQIWAGGVINNSGATTWTGPGLLRGYQNSTWNNKPGSSFTMTGDGDVFSNNYGGNVFNNEANATFIKTAGDPGDASTYLDEWTVNNNGRIESQQGTLHFNTTLNLDAGSNLAGAGRVLFNGTTNLAVALPSTGHPELIGTLNATAPASAFSGTHPLNWSNGWINGTFSLQGGSVMELTTGNVKYLGSGAVFTNHGRVNWKEGLLRGYQSSTFNNESGGVFDAFTDGDIFSNNYGGNVFNNAAGALFVKSGKGVTPGSTSFVDEWTFNNSGAVRSDDGTLQFNTVLNLFGGGSIGHAGSADARVLSTHYFVLTGTTTVSNVTFETAGDWHGNVTEGTAGNGTIATTGSGKFEWSGGTAHNTVNIAANSDFRITGNAVKQIGGGGVLHNSGHATWSGDGQLRGYQSSTFSNLPGATFTAVTDADFHNNYGGNAFVNAVGATFEKTAGSDRIDCNWAFNNAGTVLASSGALGMNSGGVSSGTFAPSTGGEIQFLGGQHDLITGANCTGTGIVRVNGGVVNAVNPVTSNFTAGLLEISAGAVTSAAAGSFGVSGHIDWTGGTIAGVFNISPGSDFSLDGGDVKWIGSSGVINNSGAATWNPPGLLRGYQVGTWNNKSGGSFTMTGDGDVFANNYSGNIFNNEAGAQFVKTTGGAGDASTYIDEWTFNNNGAVSSQQGTLHFNTTLNLDAGSTLAGAGRVLLNGTTNLTTLLASTGNPELVGSLNGNTPTAGYSGSQPFIWSSGGINGTFTLQNGSVLELTTGNVKQIGGFSVFNNFGRVNWKAGLLRGYQSSVFNNESGAIFDAFTDGDVFANYYSGNVFNNKSGALFVKSGKSGTPDDSTFLDEWTFNNSGVLRSDDGLLRFHTALMLDAGGSITRAGVVPAHVLSSGYLVLTGTTAVSNVTFESSGDWHGNLSPGSAGNGTIATSAGGVFEWTGGTAHNTVNIAPGSVFAISGGGVKQLGGGGVLNNGGIATRTGSGELRGYQSSTFVNLPGAVFNVNTSAPFTNYYGGNRLTNSGVLNIGAGADVLPLHWSFTQTGTGRLNLEIGGTNPATPEFDQLHVSGDAVLAGSIGVSLINGYAPPADTTFPVLAFGSRSGSFGHLVSPGLIWGTQYNANNLTLIAKTYPTTLAEWKSYFFADPGSTDAQSFADFDRDGVSNLMEYALGRDPRAGGASGIVPGKVVIRSDTYLTLTFTRPAGAAALTDVNYGGERSGSLGGWSSAGVVVESVVPVPEQEKETVTLRSAQPVSGASKDFLRLKATVGN